MSSKGNVGILLYSHKKVGFYQRLLVKEQDKCQYKGNTEQSLACLRVNNDNVGSGCLSAELN